MKEQIKRAKFYFKLAEKGASQLDKASRWPVCILLFLGVCVCVWYTKFIFYIVMIYSLHRYGHP